jgi:phosphohistidine phosphatase
MKKLILVRHAKSGWTNPNHTDFERELSERGLNDASILSALLPSKITKPDIFFSSPAIRALHTAKIFAEKFDLSSEKIVLDDGIYSKGTKYIINLLKSVKNEVGSTILFGHNPDITSLASYLSGEYFENVPTCGIVVIEFESDRWDKIEDKNGKLVLFDYPKLYKNK